VADMKRSIPPVIDDADVDRWVDIIRRHADFSKATSEERANRLHDAALQMSLANGDSEEYANELARRVRQRALWVKPLH